jgi:hypothetical protein
MEIWAFAMRNDRNRSKLHAKQPINPRANVHTGAEQIKQHIEMVKSDKSVPQAQKTCLISGARSTALMR